MMDAIARPAVVPLPCAPSGHGSMRLRGRSTSRRAARARVRVSRGYAAGTERCGRGARPGAWWDGCSVAARRYSACDSARRHP